MIYLYVLRVKGIMHLSMILAVHLVAFYNKEKFYIIKNLYLNIQMNKIVCFIKN